MFNIINNFVELFNLRDLSMAIYELFELIFMILFVAHLSACVLHLVSIIEESYDIKDSWIIKYNL